MDEHKEAMRVIALAIERVNRLPKSRELSLVVTKLQEATMWLREDAFRGHTNEPRE